MQLSQKVLKEKEAYYKSLGMDTRLLEVERQGEDRLVVVAWRDRDYDTWWIEYPMPMAVAPLLQEGTAVWLESIN